MKYTDTQIGFQEFPDEISLLINISNCPFHCPGCHSPELWEDVGTELNIDVLIELIEKNKGITCVGLMGGNPGDIGLLGYVHQLYPGLKTGWYWGGRCIPEKIWLSDLDYIKIGRYDEKRGPLSNPNTNQRFYHVLENGELEDWTYKFWKRGK